MDTNASSILGQINYTLREKYLQIEPEGRIGKKQFLIRSAYILGISTYILIGIYISMYNLLVNSDLIKNITLQNTLVNSEIEGFHKEDFLYLYMHTFIGIFILCTWYIPYRAYYSLLAKRINDIGEKNSWIIRLFGIVIILTIITLFILTLIGIGLIDLSIQGELRNGWDLAVFIPFLLGGYIFLCFIVALVCISLLTILSLYFKTGNKGDNEYGKDPINTKVVFLG